MKSAFTEPGQAIFKSLPYQAITPNIVGAAAPQGL